MTDTGEVLVLPVPESVGAAYLVPTVKPPDDPAALIAQELRFPPFLNAAIRDWLAAPRSPVSVHSIREQPLPPLELIAAGGRCTEDQLARVAGATHSVLLVAHGPPGGQPVYEWVARGAASVVAAALGADIIDPLTFGLLPPHVAAASLPGEDRQIRLVDWVAVEYSPDRHGYWCTTNGLRRFGLPELQTLTTPPNVVEQWGNALSGIAVALINSFNRAISRDRSAAFVELPATLRVSTHHVAIAYGHRLAESREVNVRLALDPPGPERHLFLTIHPPLDWSGSAGEHIAEACATLFGARQTQLRRAPQSEAMDEAIATARAGVPRIRSRFESGQLGLHTKLLVKYALPTPEGTEYLWAYVTSWRDPNRILATSADDAVYDSKLRSGRPVVVDAAAVIDWAVEHDELGVIEGAWTQAALDDDT